MDARDAVEYSIVHRKVPHAENVPHIDGAWVEKPRIRSLNSQPLVKTFVNPFYRRGK